MPQASDIEIRRIAADELDIVQHIAETVWPHAYDGVIERHQIEIMLADIYALDTLRNDMAELDHVYWIARRAGTDMAFASAYKEDEVVWIKKLYVLPDVQGSGFGKALMQLAAAHFAPARALSLYVNKGNAGAIAYYQHRGFAIEKEVPVKMGPFDFIDYVMTKGV